MLSKSNGINLQNDMEYFIRNQAYELGNYIIIKGCSHSGGVGINQKAKMRFTGVKTPDAVKQTNEFTAEVFKTFDPLTYELADKIASTTGFIPEDWFAQGKVVDGVFSGLIRTIQVE